MRALDLAKELKKGCAPGYIITGDDEYLKRFVKESLLATIPKEERMFSYIPMDLNGQNKAAVSSILSAAETYTMMLGAGASKKMISVAPFDQDLSKTDRDLLKDYFANPAPDSFILFEGADKAQDFLVDIVEVIDCSKCSDTELYIFIDKKRAALGYKMDAQVIKELISLCGNDFGNILTEFEKLSMYAYDTKEITKDMLSLLVPPNLDVQVFELTNALSKGETHKALEILDKLKIADVEPRTIFSALCSTYRRLFQIARAKSSDEVILNALKISNGALFMNRKVITQNRASNLQYIPQLKDAIKFLSTLEGEMKSFVIEEDKALELAISYLIKMQGNKNGHK